MICLPPAISYNHISTKKSTIRTAKGNLPGINILTPPSSCKAPKKSYMRARIIKPIRIRKICHKVNFSRVQLPSDSTKERMKSTHGNWISQTQTWRDSLIYKWRQTDPLWLRGSWARFCQIKMWCLQNKKKARMCNLLPLRKLELISTHVLKELKKSPNSKMPVISMNLSPKGVPRTSIEPNLWSSLTMESF